MSYHHYKKQLPFAGAWQDDYVYHAKIEEQLERLHRICSQTRNRPILEEQLQPSLDYLGKDRDKVQMLGKRIIKDLQIEDPNRRHEFVMGCVDGIFRQFGKV